MANLSARDSSRFRFLRLAYPALALVFLVHRAFAGELGIPTPPPRPFELAPQPEIPLPPTRPETFGAPPPAPEAKAPESSAETVFACTRVLASGHIVASIATPVIGPNGCGIAAPLKIEAVVLTDGRRVALEPHALVRCDMAEALGEWVREDLAPLAEKEGGLATILGSDGYQCRGRNGVPGATLSEHAKGNAFDWRGVVLRNGKTLAIEHQNEAREFMELLRTGACLRFTTVLGPGSDGYHETHLHVDIESRHSGYRICQWDIK